MKCGWLMIRRSFSKGWHRRFLKLNGCYLTVSTDDIFTQIKERIFINTDVHICLTNSSTVFSLVMPDGASYQISAGNSDDLVDWVNALKTASMEEYEIGIDSFEQIKAIGQGHFSRVYLARMVNNDEYVAVKVSNERRDIAVNEKELISNMDNPFVVGYRFFFDFNGRTYLGLEYTAAGDLFTRFEFEISRRDALIYASDLLAGMNYLHHENVLIRDVKPENILLSADGHLKVADFGLAKDMKGRKTTRTICGTADYSAPEVLRSEEYGRPADVWSYGVVLYEILYNCSPFFCENELKMYERITEGSAQYPEEATEDEKEVLEAIFKKEPNERPTFDDLKKFAFFSAVDWTLVEQKKYETDFIPEASEYEKSSDVVDFEYDCGSI